MVGIPHILVSYMYILEYSIVNSHLSFDPPRPRSHTANFPIFRPRGDVCHLRHRPRSPTFVAEENSCLFANNCETVRSSESRRIAAIFAVKRCDFFSGDSFVGVFFCLGRY